MKIEVVVYNIESALNALDGGADRVEVCADPGAGGTTPSAGTVDVIRHNLSIDVYAMLRPRAGDFLYSSYEYHAMKRDLSTFQRLSVDGVVFGILTAEGRIDIKRCAELVARARPLKVTCHRAFDRTIDPLQALEDCIEAGFDRILTSGGRNTAEQGVAVIAELQKRAGGRIQIMAGSGINENNVAAIVRNSGVAEVHFSATSHRDSTMNFTNTELTSMGTDAENEFRVRTVDPEKIQRMRLALQSSNLLP